MVRLIVTNDVSGCIERYSDQMRGLNKCRRSGMMNGTYTLIVPRQMLQFTLMGGRNVTDVIWDGFDPSPKEQHLVKRPASSGPVGLHAKE